MRVVISCIILIFGVSAIASGQQPGRLKQREKIMPNRSTQFPGKRFDLQSVMKRLDANQNGSLEQNEIPAPLFNRLAAADTNQDGSLSKDELAAAFRNRMARPGNGPPGGNQEAKGDGAGPRGMPADPGMMIRRLDKNGDQLISMEEAPERMKERFGEIDKNGDNNLDASEIESLAIRMKANAPSKRGNGEENNGSRGQLPKRPPGNG
jgi:hypothetical protein